MKRKSYIIILSFLLILQIFFYKNRVSEQKKDAIVPDALVTETTNNISTLEAERVKAEKLEMEKISFQQNPMNEYYRMNPDYVGWLKIENTAIDYPVVRGSDNDYYLNHNFYREKDLLGAIFMDHRNIGMGKDKHTVIYGHYAKHGQMFKDLDRYLSEDFLNNHPELTLNDAFAKHNYTVFSVHHSYADPTLIDLTFEGDEFSAFTKKLKVESLFAFDTPVSPEDNILTLVTCNYTVENGRLFIHAVELTN